MKHERIENYTYQEIPEDVARAINKVGGDVYYKYKYPYMTKFSMLLPVNTILNDGMIDEVRAKAQRIFYVRVD